MLNIEVSLNTVTNTQPAYFGKGTRLTVLEPDVEVTPPTVKILKPSPRQGEKKRTLVCVASGFYPDHVTVSWKVDGEERVDGVATDNMATDNMAKRYNKTSYSITSRLTVPVKQWHNRSIEFMCEVNFFNGSDIIPYNATIRGVRGDYEARRQYLNITQSAKLTYSTFIAKSCIYAAFVLFLLWKLKKSSEKE